MYIWYKITEITSGDQNQQNYGPKICLKNVQCLFGQFP